MSNLQLRVVMSAVGAILIGLLLSACGTNMHTTAGDGVPLRSDSTPIPIAPNNLIGKSLAEVGQFALQQAVLRGDVRSGTPQPALVRSVTRPDLPQLGLNCMPDWGSIEEPPYILVILKGDFQPNIPWPQAVSDPRSEHYIAYVYDVWAGEVTLIDASFDDGHFKTALNDPSLPDPRSSSGTTCPDYQGPRTLHYGDTLPPGPDSAAL